MESAQCFVIPFRALFQVDVLVLYQQYAQLQEYVTELRFREESGQIQVVDHQIEILIIFLRHVFVGMESLTTRKPYALDRASEMSGGPEEAAGYERIVRGVNSVDGTRSLYTATIRVRAAGYLLRRQHLHQVTHAYAHSPYALRIRPSEWAQSMEEICIGLPSTTRYTPILLTFQTYYTCAVAGLVDVKRRRRRCERQDHPLRLR